MSTVVRSYSKINLGLAIGPARPDGFHELTTLYQTLELHDLVTVKTVRAARTRISITSNHKRVPTDGRNTCWKMIERALERMGVAAEVTLHIEKRLPVQGGLGAGSANAVAALIGLERELCAGPDSGGLAGPERLRLAGEVGSDVPLFLLGGAVVGLGRGEQVTPLPDMPSVFCVVAVPEVGVSTPQAFRDWDGLMAKDASCEPTLAAFGGEDGAPATFSHENAHGTTEAVPLTRQEASGEACEPTSGGETATFGAPGSVGASNSLTQSGKPDRLNELSLAYASLYAEPGTSGIIRDSHPGNKQEGFEQLRNGQEDDLAENALLSLVRTGVENDFERVVFPAYPSLREIKRQLMGNSGYESGQALYAALSGSGSALFGLYRSEADARQAQQRVQSAGVKALMTKTLPRRKYWTRMFAE